MAHVETSLLLFFVLSLHLFSNLSQVQGQIYVGVLSVENKNGPSSESSTYCISYNPSFHDLPKTKNDAESMDLVDITASSNYSLLCHVPPLHDISHVNGSVVAVMRGNCTFSEKAAVAQSLGSKAILIVSRDELIIPNANSSSDYNSTNIIVSMISFNDFNDMKNIGPKLLVKFYSPPSPGIDYNLIVIWTLAVLTVAIGSLWSGSLRYQLWLHKLGLTQPDSRQWSESVEEESKGELEFSPKIVIFAVLIMCTMLLGLYFLYDYLVYVIIILFAFASSLALHDCLRSIMYSLPPFASCRIPANNLYCLKKRPEIKDLIILFLSLCFGLWWIIARHQRYAWILQDILGVIFCIHMMKKIRLQNFQTCFIMLMLLFFYDIFFVFITPLFTKNGHSVMVDVATGGGSKSGESLPMVLLVPRINGGDSTVCYLPYSLLGFGDILVPGLLISFCYGFDLQIKSRRIYFISTIIAYGVGLILTFVALALMKQGQPALLYLVPCTVLTTIVLGITRKEIKMLWTGKVNYKSSSSDKNDDDVNDSYFVSYSSSSSTVIKRKTEFDNEANLENLSAGEEEKMLVNS